MILLLSFFNSLLLMPRFLRSKPFFIRLASLFLLIIFFESFFYFIATDFISEKELFYLLNSVTSVILFLLNFKAFAIFFKNLRYRRKFARIEKIFMALILLAISLSLIENLIYPIHSWDAIALYDIRGIFFAQGWNLRALSYFVQFDPRNSYYYQLYPPFTSILHAWIYESGLKNPQFLYTIFYMMIVFIFFYLSKKFTNNNMIIYFSTITCAFFSPLLTLSKDAYTNIPFVLYYLFGVYFLLEYLVSNSFKNLFFGGIFLAGSAWCRVLEPDWLAMILGVIPFILISSLGLIQKLRNIFFYGLISGSVYFFWKYYEIYILKRPPVISYDIGNYKILSTAGIAQAFVILRYMYDSWQQYLWLIIMPFFVGILLLFLKKISKAQELILLVIFFNEMIYFIGTYIVSITTAWWSLVNNALFRSSLHILILGFLSMVWGLEYLSNFVMNKKNK